MVLPRFEFRPTTSTYGHPGKVLLDASGLEWVSIISWEPDYEGKG